MEDNTATNRIPLRRNLKLCHTLLLATLLATGSHAQAALSQIATISTAMPQIDPFNSASFAQTTATEKANPGQWLRLNDEKEYAPAKRYGHTAVLYEPATKSQLDNLKANLRLADIEQRMAQADSGASETDSADTAYMVVFGGKNSETDVLFNDIYFLGIPSFNWYAPRLQMINSADAPSPRLGHASAIYGDKLYIFGGHTIPVNSQEISNELFTLDLQTMTWQKVPADSQNMVVPMAYMATTVDLDQQRLAIFGGLTQEFSTSQFKVVNEVMFFDFTTQKWQKPGRVYVDTYEDMPAARMGASMVNFNGKLYVYGGADPYSAESTIFSDFYSFDVNDNAYKWKKLDNFTELKAADGTMLGQAVRMYNSDAVIFSGGCNSISQTCSFGVTKSILFNQPSAHFTDSLVDLDEFKGRMGHSLIQLGDSVISFGGCSFGQNCFNELLIQKPSIMTAENPYDCQNEGQIMKQTVSGLNISYCKCQDLAAGGLNSYYTGPQCAYETVINEQQPQIQPASNQVTTTTQVQSVTDQSQPIATAQVTTAAEPLANDNTCGAGCNDAGICKSTVCYCDKYHSGTNCEKDLAHPGVKAPIGFVFYGVALFLGLVTGGFVAKIYNDNDKHLFL